MTIQLPSGNTLHPDYRQVIEPDQLREQETLTTEQVRRMVGVAPVEGLRDWKVEFDRWFHAAITKAKAEGWDEGANSRQCHCSAWSENECGCGNYPSERNPYRTPKETNNDN